MVLLRRRRRSLASNLFLSCLAIGSALPPRLRTACAFTLNVGGRTTRLPSIAPRSGTTTLLTMAKGGIHGKKTRMIKSAKKKKSKDSKRPGKVRKTGRGRDDTMEGGIGGSKSNKRPSSATSANARPKLSIPGETNKKGSGGAGPPWQVMGQSDMKKNVEAERIRRERIRLGIDAPSAVADADRRMQRADVSGSNRLMSAADRTMLGWKRFNPTSVPSDLAMVGAYLGRELPPSLGVPEVAFLGRSNVGKSSLLNKLVSKAGGDTARVGKTPGATASVNLYALLGQSKRKGGSASSMGGEAKPVLGFADLPGFGYAKLSKETKESVEEAAERYLGRRRELALGVLLVDSRREPGADDRAVLAALFDMGVPLIVAATKSDKLKTNEVESAMSKIREGLGLPEGQPLQVSGVTGDGVRDLWRIILDACETRVEELKEAMEEGRDDGGVMRAAIDGDDDEDEDFYDNDFGGDDDEEEYFEDGEDVVYDQGYDWVQDEVLADAGEGATTGDDFYDGDIFLEDYEDVEVGGEERNWNQEKQRMENESFKLKNLKKRVEEMERRGEI